MDGSISLGLDPQPPTPSSPPPPPPRKHFILGSLAICLGLFLSYVRAWGWSYGMMNAEAWGYAAGGATLPAAIAYLIAGRKSVRNFNRFGIWFSGITVFFFLISSDRPVRLNQHIGNLMKEAAGTKPVSNTGPEAFDSLVRDMMRALLDDRKTFERETETFAPELGKLYSAETFSNQAAMQRSIDAVRGVVAADLRYSKQVEAIPERMQAFVDRSQLSQSDRQDFMAGVRKSYGDLKILQIRRQAMEVEGRWADATVSLYTFAIANAAKIRVDGEHLRIGNENILSQFNAQLEKAQKLRDDLLQLNQQLETSQRAARQESGLTPKDLGLKEERGQADGTKK